MWTKIDEVGVVKSTCDYMKGRAQTFKQSHRTANEIESALRPFLRIISQQYLS